MGFRACEALWAFFCQNSLTHVKSSCLASLSSRMGRQVPARWLVLALISTFQTIGCHRPGPKIGSIAQWFVIKFSKITLAACSRAICDSRKLKLKRCDFFKTMIHLLSVMVHKTKRYPTSMANDLAGKLTSSLQPINGQ
jgi:hypothetical protein